MSVQTNGTLAFQILVPIVVVVLSAIWLVVGVAVLAVALAVVLEASFADTGQRRAAE